MTTESKRVKCPDCGRGLMYLPEQSPVQRVFWCEIEGSEWRQCTKCKQVTTEAETIGRRGELLCMDCASEDGND